MPHDGWHPHDHGDHGHGHPHHHWHDPPTRRLVLAAATFLPFGGASAQSADAQQRIADQANRYLALLDDRQRRQVLIAFDSANRVDWHYIPRSRSGLSLGEMSAAQADAARALFATVLNEHGPETARRRAPARRRFTRATGKLARSRPLLSLGVRHTRSLPVGLALRGPSPVAERGAAGGRSCRRDAVLRRRPSGDGARRARTRASACSAAPKIWRARS